MPILLKIDDRTMRRFVNKMPKAGKRSVARSLNKAITQTRTRAAREISAKRNILVGRAKKDMRIQRASPGRPVAAIHASGKPIPVIDVKGVKRKTKYGVFAKIEAKKKPHLFKDAFIATMPGGHKGVFKREGKDRLHIIEQVLPSVASTMVQTKIEQRLRKYAIPVYEKELIRLLNFEMKKSGAK